MKAWPAMASGPKPSPPERVTIYLADIVQRLKPTTLKRRLASIAKLHRNFALPNPTDHFDVDLPIRRARRLKPQRPAQALGITAAIRDRPLAACGTDLAGLRDQGWPRTSRDQADLRPFPPRLRRPATDDERRPVAPDHAGPECGETSISLRATSRMWA
jgi:hypothetical protein